MSWRLLTRVLLICFVVVASLSIIWVGLYGRQAESPTSTTQPNADVSPTSFLPTDVLSPVPVTVTAQSLNDVKLGLLFVNPDNPRYFTDGTMRNGKYRAVYLTGSHTWCNFTDCGDTNPPTAFDYTAYLDFLKANNHNFFRLWRAENARGGEDGDHFWFSPMPYERSSSECCAFDGSNKFDLTRFNQEYFDRMHSRIVEAGNHGIYVSIMLFDGWSVDGKIGGHDPWKGHPYNLQNNVNGVNGDLNGDGQGGEIQALFDPSVLALQEDYVKKVVDTVNDLDNVLYEISNEGSFFSTGWQYHMISYVKDYELTKPKQHPVGMTAEYPGGDNTVLFASPADWISLNGDINNPPVADGKKVILSDTDHLCGICGNRQWVWKSFTRGENPIFMDPFDKTQIGRGAPANYDRNNINDVDLRLSLGYARSYADRMNLDAMSPQPELCSTGYCLTNPALRGGEYLMFLPSGATLTGIMSQLDINKDLSINLPADSKVSVDLSGSPVELLVEWFNPADGTMIDGGSIRGGAVQSFTAPFSGDAVLYLYDAGQ